MSTAPSRSGAKPASRRIEWTADLIRLEIIVWDRIDARLRERHGLPLSFFESLHFIDGAAGRGMRVGDLARKLRVTVGGTSKLADRIERAGLIAREAVPGDRRAAQLVITAQGRRILRSARATYEGEVARILDPVLTATEQRRFHDYVERLLTAEQEEE